MPKLCQVVPVQSGLKTRAYDALKTAHKELQKPALLDGFSRTYRPFVDTEEERLPPETKNIQLKATDAIAHTMKVLTEAFDIEATLNWGNCAAKADVVVDGKVLIKDAPVTYLLYLGHQLDDLATFIDKLPTLDPAETWKWDENQACYATEPTELARTKKVPTVITKAQATKEHPAQTEVFMEDKQIGRYTTTKRSGALPVARVNELRDRVQKLRDAVKTAREAANSIEVEKIQVGAAVLNFLFA